MSLYNRRVKGSKIIKNLSRLLWISYGYTNTSFMTVSGPPSNGSNFFFFFLKDFMIGWSFGMG